MNTIYNNEMFASIKDALTKEKSTSSLKDILRLEIDQKPYIVRLIPNIKDPSKTFYHFYNHGWESVATGQFVSAVSPTTWGERDPIAEARFFISKNGSDEEKERAKALNRKENWLVNVLVVSDPKQPDNIGKIKILRFGRQLHKIIMSAIEGDDAAEFGEKIFDLSSNGCNLKIKIENQGGFSSYVTSKFASPSEIPGMTQEKMQETYNNVFDLTNIFSIKSYNELKEMLETHYYGKTDSKADSNKKPTSGNKTPVEKSAPIEGDDIPMEVEKEKTSSESDEVLDSQKVEELLKDLDADNIK